MSKNLIYVVAGPRAGAGAWEDNPPPPPPPPPSSHASPRLVSEGFYTRSGSRGVTLIDTVVASGLMLLVFTGIVGVFRLSVDVVSNNKARAGAIALADERMEYIRSLSYGSIGTS